MSDTNAVTIFQQQVPAHILARDAAAVAAANLAVAAGTGGTQVNRISLKSSRFRLIVGGVEKVLGALHLDLVVVLGNPGVNKTFYIKNWAPGQEPESPDCQSNDGIRPSADVVNKQHATCAGCPQNEWGSKINAVTGGKIKACSDAKRVAVVAAGRLEGDLYQLSIPPASLKDFGALLKQLNQISPPVAYNDVVIRVSFDAEASYPKLKFEPVRYLSEEESGIVKTRSASSEARMVCSIDQFVSDTGTTSAAVDASAKAEIAAADSTKADAEAKAAAQEAKAAEEAAKAAAKTAKAKAAKDKAEAEAKAKAKAEAEAAAAKTAETDDSGFGGDEPPVEKVKAAVADTVVDAAEGTTVVGGEDIDAIFGADWN